MDILKKFTDGLARMTFSDRASIDTFPDFSQPNLVLAFAELGQAVSFAEPALVEDEGVRREILNLLQEETGKLKGLNWLLFDPGTKEIGEDGEDWRFKGQAEQALSSIKSQYYSFTFNGKTGQMVYKLTNPSSAADFGESTAYDFAASGKKLNCKPGNVQCGGKCQNGKLNCYHGMTPAQKKAAQAAAKSAAKVVAAAPPPASAPPAKTTKPGGKKKPGTSTPPAPTASPAPTLNPAIKTNDKALTAGRQDLINRVGQKLVEDAEKNTHKILNDKSVDVFIRVRSSDTLEKILGDRFKGAVELGIKTHQIPNLQDKDYTVARKRVEEFNGYDKNTKPEDRPISGYFGSSDLKGASHDDIAQAYGSIAVKMKPQVKDRVTFTGADSFKSGVPSPLNSNGTPPPPSAASIASLTRHGYDLDKLPNGYPSFYKDKTVHQGQLQAASKAKDVNDLVKAGAPTGNAYIEAQIHGQVKPSDIAELHFSPTGTSDRPNAAIASWAKANGVKVYTNGKEENLDDLINPPKVTKTKVQEVNDAISKGDFHSVMDYAIDVRKQAKAILGQGDAHLSILYKDAGYDGLPKIVSENDVTNEWKNNGGTLMIRGVNPGTKSRTQYMDEFQSGTYYAGEGMYGNGTYVSHAGQPPNTADAKDMWKAVAKRNSYVYSSGVTMRMVLPKDANIITQADFSKEVKQAMKDMDDWATSERKKIQATQASQASLSLSSADAQKVNAQKALVQADLNKDYQTRAKVTPVPSLPNLPGEITEAHQVNLLLKKGASPLKSGINTGVFLHERLAPAKGKDRFVIADDKGNIISEHAKKGDAAQAAINHYVAEIAYAQAGVPFKWIKNSNKSQAEIDFDTNYKTMKDVIFGDSSYDQCSGRFAVVRGYDAIALNKSYEPKRFMNLLNRSKVIIQSNEVDYNTGLQKIAG